MMRPARRNVGPMMASARCGAKTRSGGSCKSPAVAGKKRCRMHGGAPGSGAPRGNRNAVRHGRFTAEKLAERRQMRETLRRLAEVLADVKSKPG